MRSIGVKNSAPKIADWMPKIAPTTRSTRKGKNAIYLACKPLILLGGFCQIQ